MLSKKEVGKGAHATSIMDSANTKVVFGKAAGTSYPLPGITDDNTAQGLFIAFMTQLSGCNLVGDNKHDQEVVVVRQCPFERSILRQYRYQMHYTKVRAHLWIRTLAVTSLSALAARRQAHLHSAALRLSCSAACAARMARCCTRITHIHVWRATAAFHFFEYWVL